jgi:hypothetical protein
MSFRRIIYVFTTLFLICLLGASAGGENAKSEKPVFDKAARIFQPYIDVLGAHVQKKGKEKRIYTGEYFEAGKSSNVRAVVQLPRMARLEGFKDKNSVILFDGKNKNNAKDRIDNALLDTFLIDTAEGMLASVEETNLARLLGLDFKPDPRTNPKYSGPFYDIYEVMAALVFINDLPFQSRRYYFDSGTQLLDRTVYYDRSVSTPVKIETRFSVWGKIDGSAYPARFERFENDKLIFSFIATGIESGPGDDVSKYR